VGISTSSIGRRGQIGYRRGGKLAAFRIARRRLAALRRRASHGFS
jgi:hypothetical protein